jgi:hypothetical protein
LARVVRTAKPQADRDTGGCIRIEVGTRRIEVRKGFDPATLAALLDVLEMRSGAAGGDW